MIVSILQVLATTVTTITISWTSSTDNVGIASYEIYRDGVKIGTTVAKQLSYKDTNLASDTSHIYTVKAKSTLGILSDASLAINGATALDTIAPTAPTNLVVSSKTDNIISLTWNASEDNGTIVNYYIYCNGTYIDSSTTKSYTCKGLTPNTNYTFTVRARDDGKNMSGESNSVTDTTYNDDYGDDINSATPIQVGESSNGTINYANDVDFFKFTSTGASNYYINLNNYSYTILDCNGNNVTLSYDSNCSLYYIPKGSSQTYYIKVYTTSTNLGAYILTVTIPPTAPTNLQITGTTVSTVSISWTASTDKVGVTGYEIYRNGVKVGTTTATVLSYTDSGLISNTIYTYTVKTKNTIGELSDVSLGTVAATSILVDTTPPTAPTNVVVSSKGSNSISLSWTAAIDDGTIAGYYIYCNKILIGTSTTTSFTFNGADLFCNYTFSVKAVDGGNNVSDYSNSVSAAITSGTLYKDTASNGDITINSTDSVDLNGHILEIMGTLTLVGSININKGALKVNGSLIQNGGILTVNGGMLIVIGDYTLQNSSILRMTNENDYIYVGGNFTTKSTVNHLNYLSSGILEIKGNFSQIYTGASCNFWTTGDNTVILSGTTKQSVWFDTPNVSHFIVLVIDAPFDTGYTFNKTPVWSQLIEGYKSDTHFGADEYNDDAVDSDGTNAATGNYSQSYTDLADNATGFGVNFTRTYNSKNHTTGGAFGDGWSFGFECKVSDYSGILNEKIVTLPNGSTETFKINADGTFTAMDSRNVLQKQADGTYVLTTKDQSSYGFNANGYLSWIKDKNSNVTIINADANGKVQNVTDDAGRIFTISYNAQGLIQSISGQGRIVSYEYDNNKLSKVTDPMNIITRYVYDSNGYLNEIKDNDNNLVEKISYITSGVSKNNVYQATDAFGNVKTYNYDVSHLKTTITDSNGIQSVIVYDGSYNVLSSTDAEGKTSYTTYFLDSNGINNYGEQKSQTDRNGNITQYQRDTNGNITVITNSDGSTVAMTYDSKNNLTSVKDENGKYTYYIYDGAMINVIKKVQPLNGTDAYSDSADQSKFAVTIYVYYSEDEAAQLGYNINGLLKCMVDSNGNTTTYTYDADGNAKTLTDAVGNITTNNYNSIGWKTSTVSPQGYTTTYTYDNDDNLIKTVLNGGETSRIVYDSDGRKVQETSANLYDPSLDNITTDVYSGNVGNRYTYYANGKIKTATDANNNVTTFTYDIYGNILSETKANGSVYTFTYDVMNRVTNEYFAENASDAPSLLVSYSYSILSNKNTEKIETKYLNSTDKAVTTYIYDYANRLIEQDNPDGTKLTVNFNANGTKNTSTDANGSTTYYKYDGLNRLTEQWTPFEVSNGATLYSYSKITYDKAGNKIAEIVGKDKVTLNSVPTNVITTNYEYYNNGKLKDITDSSGRRTEYTYDKDGNVTEEVDYVDNNTKNVTDYTNNYFGKPVTKTSYVATSDIYLGNSNNQNTALTTTYTYDKDGNVKTITTPDNVTTTYCYDDMDRQLSGSKPSIDEKGNATAITNSVSYDSEGNKVTSTDANGNTTTYVYDARGLLVKTIDAKGNTTVFYYDTAGRKIAEVAPNDYSSEKALSDMNRIEYTYDLLGRIKTITSIYFDTSSNQWKSIVTAAYKYDNNGNVIKTLDALGYEAGSGATEDDIINSGYGVVTTYNLANKPVTILNAETQDRNLLYTISYAYDGAGRKISETNANGVITTYYYNDAGNILSTTVKKSSSSPEVTLQTNTYDLLGNVKTHTDGNGNVTTYEYNVLNKVRKVTYPEDSTIQAYTITYQYDVMGRLVKQHDSLGKVDLYTYDNLGHQLTYTEEGADGTNTIATSIAYDKNGNKRFVTDGNNVITENTYDSLNVSVK